MLWQWSILILLSLTVGGCDWDDKHQARSPVSPSMYQPPADGKLTRQQLVQYIAARQKIIHDSNAQKHARKSTTSQSDQIQSDDQSFHHFDDVEKVAASAVNMSYQEFLWVKDKVITARTQSLLRQYYQLNNRIMTLLDQTLTRYRETPNSERNGQDDEQVMEDYIAEMHGEITGLREKTSAQQELTEAQEYNILLVEDFRDELDALQELASRTFVP